MNQQLPVCLHAISHVRLHTSTSSSTPVTFFEKLARNQQRSRVAQFARALRIGDKDERDLQGILGRLDRARDLLCVRIQTAQVGLEGNLQDGFRVAFDVLTETNNRVQQVLGINLALMDRLDRMIAIDVDNQEELGLGDQAAARDATRAADADEVSIYDNITPGQARIMIGNVGVEKWQRVAGRKATIASNRFEKDVKMMIGDLGGQAAADFNQSFWD
ncbi:hypothetical protein F5Y16DRAFT_404851 [Xylariaceae sp. FL0255]|nr:hypothetical protein F5Y16DRAFT_404851 [Xylariaceae sp. FL0255]